LQMIIPQTFANFDYTINSKQLTRGYRIRINATRKNRAEEKKPEVKEEVVKE
jgi:hypothetical protein